MLQAAEADRRDLSDTAPVCCSSNLLNTCTMPLQSACLLLGVCAQLLGDVVMVS